MFPVKLRRLVRLKRKMNAIYPLNEIFLNS